MQVRRGRRIRRRPRADQQIEGWEMRQEAATDMLAETTAQAVARDGAVPEAGCDHPQPRMPVTVGAPDDLEPRGAPAGAGSEDRLNLGGEP